MQQSPPEKLTGLQVLQKFPELCETQMFITAFTSARQASLSWSTSIHSMPPHPASWSYVLILSSHLCLALPSGLFPSGLPTKPSTHFCCPPRALYLILFYLITRIMYCMKYRSQSCSLRGLLRSPVTSWFLGPKIFLSTLFSNTLSLCSFLNLQHQVLHPYKRTGEIAISYRLNFVFFE